jgi:hypothetical protein
MIAKISSSNNLYGALSYNQIKVDESQAKVILTNNMIESVDGKCDIHLSLKSFEPYLSANRRTEKPVLHISLNSDPKDNLSDEQLSKIAQIYMQKMGYGNQPFIVYKHEDIEREHLHIVSLRVDENGKKIDHNFERRHSMEVCRALERQYGLIPADQKQRQQGIPLKPVRPENGDIKHQIANVIRPIAKDYHFQSLKEYRTLLSLYNIGVEEVRGEVKDKQYKGLIYFALNDRGEKAGNPFKSSLFGKSVGIEALENRIEKSAEIIKDKKLKERSKREIAAVMRGTSNRAEFEKALEKKGITVLLRTNNEGRIYGATFIDHEQQCVFNGSRLGREFSANVFNEFFNGQTNGTPTTGDSTLSPNPQPSQHFQSDRDFGENSNLGGIFDFLTPENSVSDEIAEQDLTRRMKKKKKKQRKL